MPSRLSRLAMGLQSALLRRNWLGSLGDFVMVITTTGRRTGRAISTPIAYVRDGSSLLALTVTAVGSNWYRNLRARPEAVLEVRGEAVRVRAEFLDSEAERQSAVAAFRAGVPGQFRRLVGVALDAPAAELAAAVAARQFVRFTPVPG
jgi:deazaflavin-dependent oxidoreductase (nitroreductase family)